uniref:hypothetical protein n=1 Tax=Cephaloticoccus sp. TaxID=1985742 RepID=UPI00404AF973
AKNAERSALPLDLAEADGPLNCARLNAEPVRGFFGEVDRAWVYFPRAVSSLLKVSFHKLNLTQPMFFWNWY